MDWIRILSSRCAAIFRRRNLDEDLDNELRSHIDFAVEENRTRGMSGEEARTTALRAFGGVTQTKETYRVQRGLPFLEVLAQDVRYALRQLLKSSGFTCTVILILGLGIGANTAVFSVVDDVLLRPLPYDDPDRLVWIHDGMTQQDKDGWSACMADFLIWRTQSKSFVDLAAFLSDRFTLTGDGRAEELAGADVSADFFKTLGVQPILGRTFAANADQPGRERVAVISERLWRDRYSGRPDILNKSILLDGNAVAVIGVMSSKFRFRLPDIDVWQILQLTPPIRRGPFILHGVARLKPGVDISQANTEMSYLAQQVERADPKGVEHLRYPVEPLRDVIVGDIRPLLAALAGAVALVLLISIFNVASLLLTRAVTRQQEIAIRVSIGAGRRRLVQQLLTESLLLSLSGGAVGVAVALLGIRVLRTLAPPGITPLDMAGIDGRVLLFTALLSVLCGVIFGVVPAVAAARPNLALALREGGSRGGESRGHRALRNAMVVGEIALSAVLLAGAGLLIRSFVALDNVPAGFNARADQLITMRISPSGGKYAESTVLSAYWSQVVQRISGLPGVESTALSVWLPPDHSAMSDSFEIQGKTPPDGGPVVPVPIVTQDYFKTLQIPLLRGRYFDDRDTMNSPRVTIISQDLARRYFPGEDPIGKKLKHGGPNSANPPMEIIGVAGDVKYEGMAVPDEPVYYEASSQVPDRPMWLVVRAHGNADGLRSAIQSRISTLDADVPISKAGSMAESMDETVALPRFRTLLMGAFACTALLLAAVGIYGLMAYSVLRRTPEMAIRMALGANRTAVVAMVFKAVLMQTAAGLSIGIPLAFLAGHLVSSLLYKTRAYDPLAFIGSALVIVLCALLAGLIPALRAASIDPIAALRME